MSIQIKLEGRLVSWPVLLHFFPEKLSLWQGCCRAQHWQVGSGEDNVPKKEQEGCSRECYPVQPGIKG